MAAATACRYIIEEGKEISNPQGRAPEQEGGGKILECNHCKELELLKVENSQLKRDQEFLFLVMDIGLEVIEKWAKENGLLVAGSEDSEKDFANRNNQVRIFIEKIRKADQDALFDRLIGLLDRLKSRLQ